MFQSKLVFKNEKSKHKNIGLEAAIIIIMLNLYVRLQCTVPYILIA